MTPQQRTAIRVVVGLLIASLTVSVGFALLTLVFRNDVVAYQLARQPGADRAALQRTLWTRPVPILAVAVLYIWVTRQLLAGVAAAYRRVRIVSAFGFVAVAYLVVAAEYPAWLRGLQAVQLLLLALLVLAVNRPVVRSAFPRVPDPRPRNRKAAWLLVGTAPVVAELTLGTIPLRMAWVLLIFTPLYGGGALFVREIVRRAGGGYANLLLMGVAYGIVEEGLVLQSLTSPHLYHAAGWAPRLLGVNTDYTLLNLVYHAVFSITVPVVVVELCFPGHGQRPYLRRGGLIATGLIALAGAGIVRLTVPPAEDPGYTMPLAAVLVFAAVALAVTVVALRVRVPGASPARPPSAPVVAAVAGAGALLFFGLAWPFGGATGPVFTHGTWSLLPMVAAAALVVALVYWLRRWSAAAQWTREHLVAACTGALVGHTVFGLAAQADGAADRLFLAAVAAATLALGTAAIRRPVAPVLLA
ncbi:hypothetical protein Dvina_21150 [Dactylosporangium vinaceum]|uniref:Integral membrane protein n=1 Tax=Dactylosporangium vinaceum TaxID=53362 RepID=A0ABV5MRU2_9ACTN|nr:hypothetical protein [Dactylosporangium vinaceum]UAC00339.1 hypothetical protein Dvina_21150 [Dactylosporangium vinaceum]